MNLAEALEARRIIDALCVMDRTYIHGIASVYTNDGEAFGLIFIDPFIDEPGWYDSLEDWKQEHIGALQGEYNADGAWSHRVITSVETTPTATGVFYTMSLECGHTAKRHEPPTGDVPVWTMGDAIQCSQCQYTGVGFDEETGGLEAIAKRQMGTGADMDLDSESHRPNER